ncbi:MAG: polyprenol monophosphomannose synthase [Bdellovibrionales bacterium]|nr:polyprenol monophosphomannose synthase [Bdellovibrionales bacterium]
MIDRALIIIPTYNEALNVHTMIERLFHLYPGISVLIIDDNSPDHTSRVVEDLQLIFPHLFLIKRSGKLGLGTAYLEGFRYALEKDFAYIVQMDCDFSHDPKDVKNLLEAVDKNDADLAIGSRYSDKEIRTPNWSIHRLVISTCASFIFRSFTGMKVKDMQGGFKAFKKKTLVSINLDNILSRGYVFQFEINYKVHAKKLIIKEVPIIFYQRLLGESKMSIGIVLEAMKVFIRLRMRKFLGTLN